MTFGNSKLTHFLSFLCVFFSLKFPGTYFYEPRKNEFFLVQALSQQQQQQQQQQQLYSLHKNTKVE